MLARGSQRVMSHFTNADKHVPSSMMRVSSYWNPSKALISITDVSHYCKLNITYKISKRNLDVANLCSKFEYKYGSMKIKIKIRFPTVVLTHRACSVSHQQPAPVPQDTHRCTWESACLFVVQADTCSYSLRFHLSLCTS